LSLAREEKRKNRKKETLDSLFLALPFKQSFHSFLFTKGWATVQNALQSTFSAPQPTDMLLFWLQQQMSVHILSNGCNLHQVPDSFLGRVRLVIC